MNRKAKQRRRTMKTLYGRLRFGYKRIKSHIRTAATFLRSKERKLGRPLLMRETTEITRTMRIKALKSVSSLK